MLLTLAQRHKLTADFTKLFGMWTWRRKGSGSTGLWVVLLRGGGLGVVESLCLRLRLGRCGLLEDVVRGARRHDSTTAAAVEAIREGLKSNTHAPHEAAEYSGSDLLICFRVRIAGIASDECDCAIAKAQAQAISYGPAMPRYTGLYLMAVELRSMQFYGCMGCTGVLPVLVGVSRRDGDFIKYTSSLGSGYSL